MTYVTSSTETYSEADIEVVFRRFTADLRMIADSSGALTRAKAEEYGSDIEYLAKRGYLKAADVTLIAGGEEIKALRYTVNTAAGDLTSSRPGGVLWPRATGAHVRVIITYTQAWWALGETARSAVRQALSIPWGPCSDDTSHATLTAGSGRAFVSNAYGVERQDYA